MHTTWKVTNVGRHFTHSKWHKRHMTQGHMANQMTHAQHIWHLYTYVQHMTYIWHICTAYDTWYVVTHGTGYLQYLFLNDQQTNVDRQVCEVHTLCTSKVVSFYIHKPVQTLCQKIFGQISMYISMHTFAHHWTEMQSERTDFAHIFARIFTHIFCSYILHTYLHIYFTQIYAYMFCVLLYTIYTCSVSHVKTYFGLIVKGFCIFIHTKEKPKYTLNVHFDYFYSVWVSLYFSADHFIFVSISLWVHK